MLTVIICDTNRYLNLEVFFSYLFFPSTHVSGEFFEAMEPESLDPMESTMEPESHEDHEEEVRFGMLDNSPSPIKAQKNKFMCYPQQLEDLGKFLAICTGTHRNLISQLHRNPPQPHQPSAPEPSGTSLAICTGTLRNLISHLHRNPPEPHQPSAPEPSGTSLALCTGTLRNLISHLPRNPPELHQPSTPEGSGTFSGTWRCSCTGSRQSYSGLKTP